MMLYHVCLFYEESVNRLVPTLYDSGSVTVLFLVHSFILDNSIAPLQVHYAEVLPTTALILCWS